MEGCIGMGIGLLGCLRGTGDGEYIRLAAECRHGQRGRKGCKLCSIQHPLFCRPAISFFDKLTQT